jgi:uncharacterized protein (DUF302 family)
MKNIITTLGLIILLAGHANADDGLITTKSRYNVDETLDRLESVVKKKGLTVFARIDHAAGAKKVGQELRPTRLLIFGNPKVGTLLMQSNQVAGIDLPMKALAWEDADGQVWLTINTAGYLAKRHSIGDREEVVRKMTAALDKFVQAATTTAGD